MYGQKAPGASLEVRRCVFRWTHGATKKVQRGKVHPGHFFTFCALVCVARSYPESMVKKHPVLSRRKNTPVRVPMDARGYHKSGVEKTPRALFHFGSLELAGLVARS